MPVLATIQYPEGKDPEIAQRLLTKVSALLMEELSVAPNQVRVTVKLMPQNRYSAGGVMAYEMDDFNGGAK